MFLMALFLRFLHSMSDICTSYCKIMIKKDMVFYKNNYSELQRMMERR